VLFLVHRPGGQKREEGKKRTPLALAHERLFAEGSIDLVFVQYCDRDGVFLKN